MFQAGCLRQKLLSAKTGKQFFYACKTVSPTPMIGNQFTLCINAEGIGVLMENRINGNVITQVQCPDNHQWGAWRYAAEGQCVLVRTCEQCGASETHVEHNWATSGYRTGEVCMHFVCKRCGEQRTVGHRYHVHGPRSEAYVCSACGYVRRRLHAFT